MNSLEEKVANLKAKSTCNSLPLSWSKGDLSSDSEFVINANYVCEGAKLELFDLMIILAPLVKSWIV